MPEFTLYWRDGKREVVRGSSAADGMTNAGYGEGAVPALDFWADGCDHEWEYISATRKWRPAPKLAEQIASMHIIK